MATTPICTSTIYAHALRAHGEGKFEVAQRGYLEVLRLEPEHEEASQALGILLCQNGFYERGIGYLEQAAQVSPGQAEIWSNLGNAYRVIHQFGPATEACRKAVGLDPTLAPAWSNLSAALRSTDDLGGSIAAAREAVRLAPQFSDALMNLGAGLLSAGYQDEAIDNLRQAAEAAPNDLHIWDNLLFASSYSASWSAAEVKELHTLYGNMFPVAPRPRLPKECKTVGFISGDFRQHPVGEFVRPLIQGLVKLGYRVCIYANQTESDETTKLFEREATTFRNVFLWDDRKIFEQIQSDKVDLLIDLAGHSAANKLPVFLLRPAPVQATFLGYSGTTGVPAIDFVIADENLIPVDHASFYTEQIVRLTHPLFTRELCEPLARTLQTGNITFGSFNNPSKISDACLGAWAQILIRTPGSELVMKYPVFDCPWVADDFRTRLIALGVESSRIHILGFVTREEHQKWMKRVDLVLDTFPYNGATTTLDALVAGLPVVTLTGENYSARMSAAMLRQLNLAQLESSSIEDYISKAIELAHAPAKLANVNDEITTAWANSGLSDGAGLATAFERAINEMWERSA